MSLFGDASAMLADFKLSAASAGLPVTARSPPLLSLLKSSDKTMLKLSF